MANVTLAWNNRADIATLSGGSWTASLPLNNLKNRQVQRVARTSNLLLTSTQFVVDFGAGQNINTIGLVVHNMSANAKVRITAASNSGFTSPEYQTSWIDVWPGGVINNQLLEWEEDNFWLGTLTPEQRAGYNAPFLHMFNYQYLRYWKIEIDDTLNSAGYIQIGRLFMSNGWQPQFNMTYGASLGFEDLSETVMSLGGAEYFDVKAKYRVHQFELDFLSEEERYNYIHELQRLCGTTAEVLIVPDKENLTNIIQRSFVGRLKSLSSVQEKSPGIFSTSIEIKELL